MAVDAGGRAVELSGAVQQRLERALLEAFPTRFALQQLARYQLDLNLNDVVADVVGLEQAAHTLVEWARAKGRLERLVRGACEENPDNPALQAVVASIVIAPGPAVTPGEVAPAVATGGLVALQSLMQADDVRKAVGEFETDFEAAAEQIDVLAAHKDLHDLLHTLQFRCFEGLARQLDRFPADDTAREIVAEHALTLDETVQRLGEVIRAPAFADGEPRWVEDLREAATKLAASVTGGDPAALRAAVRLIDRVLAVQPARVNTRLSDAARALRLQDLVGALALVHGRVRTTSLDPVKLAEFEAGIATLGTLATNLRHLVTDHDRWQELDIELRLVKNSLRDNLDELSIAWPRMRTMIQPLCASGDEWSTRFRAACTRLDEALGASGESARARSAFLQVYSLAGARFYQVDLSLQRLCENLRHIGEPLAFLLRMLR